MTTGRIPTCAAVLAAALAATAPSQDPSPPADRTNIVLFYVDDLGWKDVGYMGSQYYETPHIDALAAAGMIFTDAYACGPNCAPSRACLMSGQYSPRHGVYTVGKSTRGKAERRKLVPIANTKDLAPRFVTIAEALKAAGYTTATMGKWHLGPDPTTQGFDVNVGGNRSGSPRGGYFSPYRNPQLQNGPEREYLTDRLTDEAVAFIEKHENQPFFLYLTHYAVHTPIQAVPALTEKYRAKKPSGGHSNPKYAAMIDSVDQSLGRVVQALDDQGLTECTLIVFYSDNGGHGAVTSMSPLRGAKGMLYEGGIRVPLAVRWPARIEPGGRCEVPIIGIDLYPTLLDAARAPRPADYQLDGQSLLPLLTGAGSLPERALYWHFPAYLQATGGKRAGRPFRTRPAGAVRVGNYKLLEFFEDGRLELYDLSTDLEEATDLALTKPDKTRELHEQLREWRAAVNAPVPTTPNPRYDPELDRR